MSARVRHHLPNQRQLHNEPSARPLSNDHPRIIAPAPILYGGAFLVGVLLHGLCPRPVLPQDIAPWTAVSLLAFGMALAVWSRRTLESAGTNVNPSLPATTLVVSGPFGFSRNPMYVARTFLYLGLGLMVNGVGILLVLAPLLLVMHYGVIKPEECYLEARFGEAYRRYRSRVRRWL